MIGKQAVNKKLMWLCHTTSVNSRNNRQIAVLWAFLRPGHSDAQGQFVQLCFCSNFSDRFFCCRLVKGGRKQIIQRRTIMAFLRPSAQTLTFNGFDKKHATANSITGQVTIINYNLTQQNYRPFCFYIGKQESKIYTYRSSALPLRKGIWLSPLYTDKMHWMERFSISASWHGRLK